MKLKVILFVFLYISLVIIACKKIESKVVFQGGTSPVLESREFNVNLDDTQLDAIALNLKWTNPNYRFNSGISSQNVTYKIQIDTLGGNFKTGNNIGEIQYINELSAAITVFDLNKAIGNIKVQTDPRKEYTFIARLICFLKNAENSPENGTLISNVIQFKATPFPPPTKVPVPKNGTLWLTGSALLGGWDVAPPDNQQLQKINQALFEGTIEFAGGGGYKLLQDKGNWGSQYHMLDGGTWEGGKFEKKDADPAFPGPPDPGLYKVKVDFQEGEFQVIKL
jgi:hypothetical protein